MTLKKAFGIRLKTIRKSKGLTQEKLSELIDIHPRQMSKIENGEHFPSAKTLEKICIELQMQPITLFEFELEAANKKEADKTKEKNNKNKQEEINHFIKILKRLSKDDTYWEFIKLAINSLEDKAALDELSFVVSGMKLAKKNITDE